MTEIYPSVQKEGQIKNSENSAIIKEPNNNKKEEPKTDDLKIQSLLKMIEEKDKIIIGDEITESEEIGSEKEQSQISENKQSKKNIGLRNYIVEENAIKRYYPVVIPYLVLRAFGKYNRDPNKFNEWVRNNIQLIELKSPETAKKLSGLNDVDDELMNLLHELEVITKNNISGKTDIERNIVRYHEAIKNIKEDINPEEKKKLKSKLTYLTEIASGKEVEYLKSEVDLLEHLSQNLKEYIESLEDHEEHMGFSSREFFKKIKEISPKYNKKYELEIKEIEIVVDKLSKMPPKTNEEDYFNSTVKLFISELIEKIVSLYSKEELEKETLNEYFKKIINYLKKVDYINKIKTEIDRGWNEKDWKSFLVVVKDIDNIIKNIRIVFGDSKLADKIDKFPNKKDDDIKKWKPFFDNLALEITSVDSIISMLKEREQHLIATKSELIKNLREIISKRISQLEKMQENCVVELNKYVNSLMKDMLKNHLSEMKNINTIMISKKKEWEEIFNQVIIKESELLVLQDKLNGYLEEMNPEEFENIINNISEEYKKVSEMDKIIFENIKGIDSSPQSIMAKARYFAYADIVEKKKIDILNNLSFNTEVIDKKIEKNKKQIISIGIKIVDEQNRLIEYMQKIVVNLDLENKIYEKIKELESESGKIEKDKKEYASEIINKAA